MVTTVSRVLASLLVSMLVLLCAPSVAAPERSSVPERSTGVSSAGFWPYAVVSPVSDSLSVSLALAKWSGEQRVVPRDLPDGYTPPPVSAPGPDGAWGWVPLPGSEPPPETGLDFGLPLGRAPPLTTLN